MLLRQLLIAFLLAVTGSSAMATVVLLKRDFQSARVVRTQDGRVLIHARMTAAARAKVSAENETVTLDVAGDRRTLKLRGPIRGADVEIGPYSREVADRIVYEINRRH